MAHGNNEALSVIQVYDVSCGSVDVSGVRLLDCFSDCDNVTNSDPSCAAVGSCNVCSDILSRYAVTFLWGRYWVVGFELFLEELNHVSFMVPLWIVTKDDWPCQEHDVGFGLIEHAHRCASLKE